ncbi:MAG: protein phosphatase 2C domain-containing protein [Candidatus Hydrogenedentales bacterium]|jgi:serine/threonine protein phosphatase PrpC
MHIDAAALSHIGRKKAKNEDSYGMFDNSFPGIKLFHQGMLLTVADGLGGHTGGEIASKLAVSIMTDVLKEGPVAEKDRASEREDSFFLDAISAAMKRANNSIWQTNRELIKSKRPMGTTQCAAIIRPNYVYLGNVGDSRGYLFRNGSFIAQTEDHSWVDEQVKQGLMTLAAAEADRRKNLVTRCIGTHESIEVDTYQWGIKTGDQLLLCTDGLTNMVSEDLIADILSRPLTSKDKVNLLIDKANENGGKDNITAILAWINPDPGALRRMRMKAWLRKRQQKIKIAVLFILNAILFFLLGYITGYLVKG